MSLKRIVLAFSVLVGALVLPSAHACILNSNSSGNDFSNALMNSVTGYNFSSYDVVCKRLNSAKAKLDYSFFYADISGVWVVHRKISVSDASSGLISGDFARAGVRVWSSQPNMSGVYAVTWNDVNDDIEAWFASGEFATALKRLDEKRAALIKGSKPKK